MDGGGVQAAAGKGEAAAVTLEELRERMAAFARERDWDQFHSPRNLLLAMVRRRLPPPLSWMDDSVLCSRVRTRN